MRALACTIILVTPAAFAQEASKPPIDWSKPVVGVDSNVVPVQEKSVSMPVEVYTRQDLQELGSPSVKEFVDSLRKLPPVCNMQKEGSTVTCEPLLEAAPAPGPQKAQR